MKITHNNQEYTLDPERAIELGVLKLDYKPRTGDVFRTPDYTFIFLFVSYDGKCHLTGLHNDITKYYSNLPIDRDTFIIKVERENWFYTGNIADKMQLEADTLINS